MQRRGREAGEAVVQAHGARSKPAEAAAAASYGVRDLESVSDSLFAKCPACPVPLGLSGACGEGASSS
eukprot:scaffold10630_cov90-Isochrysis_galbana.AAC.1